MLESGPGRSEALAAGAPRLDPGFLAYLLLPADVMLLHCRQVIRHLPGVDFVDERERYVTMLRGLLLRGVGDSAGGDDE